MHARRCIPPHRQVHGGAAPRMTSAAGRSRLRGCALQTGRAGRACAGSWALPGVGCSILDDKHASRRAGGELARRLATPAAATQQQERPACAVRWGNESGTSWQALMQCSAGSSSSSSLVWESHGTAVVPPSVHLTVAQAAPAGCPGCSACDR